MSSRAPEHSELLRHAEFLRRLVRSLVRDEDRAEDVLQETWLTALTRTPRAGWAPRLWLGGIARNLARRSAEQERRRESARARISGSGPSTVTRGEAEQLRIVTEALALLDDRYQSILVLRYLHDMPPRKIARETDLPLDTVKTRLKRGLAILRDRLDAQHDGDRRAWLGVLLPLARPANLAFGMAIVTAGAVIMKTKLVVAAAIVVAGSLLAWRITGSESGVSSTEPTATTREEERRPVAQVQPIPPIESKPFEPEAENKPGAPSRLGPEEWGLRGLVRWRNDTPIPAAELSCSLQTRRVEGQADENGSYAIVLGEEAPLGHVTVRFDGHVVILDLDLPEKPREGEPRWVDWDITVPGPSTVRGRVVDTSDNPVAGVGIRIREHASRLGWGSCLALSLGNGSFEFDVPCEGRCFLELWPRLDPSGTAADTGDLTKLREATLTRDDVPEEYDISKYRLLPRKGARSRELWPLKSKIEVVLGPNAPTDAGTLVVGALGTLQFRVVYEGDQALEGVRLSIHCPTRGAWLLTLPTDAQGEAQIEHLPGKHRVSVRVRGYNLANREEGLMGIEVDVPPGGVIPVTVRVTDTPRPRAAQSGMVAISVVDSYQTPVAGARVSWDAQQGVTDREGRVCLTYREGRRGDLLIVAEGYKKHEVAERPLDPVYEHFVLEPQSMAILAVSDVKAQLVTVLRILKAEQYVDRKGMARQRIFGLPQRSKSAAGRHAVAPMQSDGRLNTLLLWSKQSGIARVDLSAGLGPGEERDVTLRPVTLATGRLVDDHGATVPGARVLTGAPDFPLSLHHAMDRPDSTSFAGTRCVGYTTSSRDGSFAVLAPAQDGLLCVLTEDGGGVVKPYGIAAELSQVIVLPCARVKLRAETRTTLEQETLLAFVHPAITLWVRGSWPEGALEADITLPWRGTWTASLLKKRASDPPWVGLSGTASFRLSGDTAEVLLPLE